MKRERGEDGSKAVFKDSAPSLSARGCEAAKQATCFARVQVAWLRLDSFIAYPSWALEGERLSGSLIFLSCCSLSPFNPADRVGPCLCAGSMLQSFLFDQDNTLNFCTGLCQVGEGKKQCLWSQEGKL